jgi:predicted regulator of Ras-like GTPase activity (Roadblock/LC7/MglB family)
MNSVRPGAECDVAEVILCMFGPTSDHYLTSLWQARTLALSISQLGLRKRGSPAAREIIEARETGRRPAARNRAPLVPASHVVVVVSLYCEGVALVGRQLGVDLQGNLALTNVADLLQFLHASRMTGILQLSRGIGGKKARVHFELGDLASAEAGDLVDINALVEILGWDKGTFAFSPCSTGNEHTNAQPMQYALMEAVRRRDEVVRQREQASPDLDEKGLAPTWEPIPSTAAGGAAHFPRPEPTEKGGNAAPAVERSDEMAQGTRTSAQILEDLLKVPGIDAVVVAGRDGFVIESAGSTNRLSIDSLGAALAHAVNSIEEMGSELRIDRYQDLFIEYGRAVILCRPVGDAVAALVAPDASKLGIIRHKAKPLFEELVHYF